MALGQGDEPDSKAVKTQPAAEQAQPTPPAPPPPQQEQTPYDYKALCDKPKTREEADLCQQWRMAVAAENQVTWVRKQYEATWVEIGALVFTVIFTAIAAIAASRAAKAANAAVEVTSRTAQQQLRAHVFVTEASIEKLAAGEQPFAHLIAVNTGQTPAYRVEFWAAVQIVNPDKELPDFERPANLRTSRYSLGTNIPTYKNLPISAKPMTEDFRQAIVRGDLTVFVWGEITYRDIFKKYRTTPFRLKFSGVGDPPRKDMTAMEEGNDPK